MHWHQWNYISQTLRDHMTLYGYQPIESPTIEAAEVFLTRAGDKIIHQLFTFDRYGQQLALRPEFTAGLARRYLQTHGDSGDTPVVRWQVAGPIFADTHNGRAGSQTYSIGAEMIGIVDSAADAEVIAAAVEGIQKLGVQDFTVVIGNVALQMHLLSRFRLDGRTIRILLSQRHLLRQDNGFDTLMQKLDRVLPMADFQAHNANGSEDTAGGPGSSFSTRKMLDVLLDSTQYGTTMGGRSRQEIARRLLEKHERAAEHQQIEAAVRFLQRWCAIETTVEEALDEIRLLIEPEDTMGQALFDDWVKTLDLLDHYALPRNSIRLRPDLTPNWDYYTGIVFTIRDNRQQIIAGGGRYDELIRLLGHSQGVPAVGFAYYVDRLAHQVTVPQDHIWQAAIQVYGSSITGCIIWARHLRKHGIACTLLNEKSGPVSSLLLEVVDEQRAHFEQQTYTDENLPALITAIKAKQQ